MNARQSRARMGCTSGYTLLEVMLVLALLAAIAGVTWPALMRPWARHELQLAAREFAEQIENARLRAMEESRVYELKWRPGSGDFEITSPDQPPADDFLSPGESLDRSAASPSSDRDPDTTDRQRQNADPDARASAGLPKGDAVGEPTTSLANLGQDDNVRRWRVPRPTHVHSRLDHGASFRDPQRAPGANSDADLRRLLDTPREGDPRDAGSAAAASPSPGSADAATGDGRPLGPGTAQDGMPLPAPWAASIWIYPEGRTSNMQWTLVSDDGYELDVELRGLTGTVRISTARRTPNAGQDADSVHPSESSIDAAAEPQPLPAA